MDFDDLAEISKMIGTMIFGSIAFLVVGMIFIQCINIKFIDNVPTKVLVDGSLVYEGPSVGVVIDSSGANTTVSVKGGFLYMFPQKYYVSKDVKLIGEK